MRMPMKNGGIDQPRAIAQIRSAVDQGVNYFDTAWPYHAGQSEPLLGQALQQGYRDKVKIATKLPIWMIKSRADMDRYLNAQLEKLATDHIDYYLVHGLAGTSWDNMLRLGVCDLLDRALADGRIANAGFSFHGAAGDFNRIVDAYPWVFCQIQYNYLDENCQAGTAGLKYAASKDLAVIVMEPLRGGKLATSVPPAVEAIWNEAPVRRTPAEWALRWIWNRPEVTVILSGMNDEAQIRENISIADAARPNALTEAELQLVQRAGRKYEELIKVGCTTCGYCMPCPSNVMIPLCFEEYNRLHMFGAKNEVLFTYALRLSGVVFGEAPGFASQCTRCGACLEKCPQHIEIPDVLAEVAAELEGPDLPDRVASVRKMFAIEAK
jgi:uncharacterized protein